MSRDQKGNCFLEFTLCSGLLLLLVGGLLDYSLYITTSRAVRDAAMEGAKIATGIRNFMAADPRVKAAVEFRLHDLPYLSEVGVTSGTQAGTNVQCDGTEVWVKVTGSYRYTLLGFFGMVGPAISRSASLRYPFC